MNAGTEHQAIVGQDGRPAFVVVPYEQFRRMKGGFTQGTDPNEVVNLSFERGVSPMAAWGEHFGLTQSEVAARIGITQAACAQMERDPARCQPQALNLHCPCNQPPGRFSPTSFI
ncbi:MAG: helix-turn-helix transcriptional regulator [Burkholderiaceae bacterium]|nr:helix-turn-helix transcriptional regulator [Burkholderiaceae bacterium]